jgi:hypothetical protein
VPSFARRGVKYEPWMRDLLAFATAAGIDRSRIAGILGIRARRIGHWAKKQNASFVRTNIVPGNGKGGENALWAAILVQAAIDLFIPDQREDALCYLTGEDCQEVCELLEYDFEQVRIVALRIGTRQKEKVVENDS